jgi:ankyrin repeat protein
MKQALFIIGLLSWIYYSSHLQGMIHMQPPLHQAVQNNDLPTIKELILAGANINAPNQDGDTPLNLAVEFEREEAVQLLVQLHANLNKIDGLGYTPLHNAILFNNFTLVNFFLASKADPNITNTATGNTPLHSATNQGLVEIVQLLIAYGVDINKTNKDGDNAIAAASLEKQDVQHCVSLLIAAGSHIHQAYKNSGWDYLPWQIEKLLILAGRCDDLYQSYYLTLRDNKQDKIGATALMYAASQADIEEVKKQLAFSANPCVQDQYGRNVFRIIEIILKNKDDLNLTEEKQETYKIISKICRNALRYWITYLVGIYKKLTTQLNKLPLDLLKTIILLIITSKDLPPVIQHGILNLKSHN